MQVHLHPKCYAVRHLDRGPQQGWALLVLCSLVYITPEGYSSVLYVGLCLEDWPLLKKI